MTSVTVTWSDTYQRACDLFREAPGLMLENEIIDHFTRNPDQVIRAIDSVHQRYDAGKIHSPWPILLRELNQRERDQILAKTNPHVEQANDERLAMIYIRNVGHLFESEILEDLYGTKGRLERYGDDPALRDRVIAAWKETQTP